MSRCLRWLPYIQQANLIASRAPRLQSMQVDDAPAASISNKVRVSHEVALLLMVCLHLQLHFVIENPISSIDACLAWLCLRGTCMLSMQCHMQLS